MSRFEAIRHRLEKLEHRLISRVGPWPPEEGSITYWLWRACGQPGERQSYWSMYQQRAKEFWKDQE